MSKLAEKIEALDGILASEQAIPLFKEAFLFAKPTPQVRVPLQGNGEPWDGDGIGPYTEEYKSWSGKVKVFEAYIDCGALLNAAMTLVPDGWFWEVKSNGQAACYDGDPDQGYDLETFADAATPALALCAAAILAKEASQ